MVNFKKFITTPAVTAVWPKLVTPETKFNAEGVYTTKFAFLSQAEEDAFIVILREADEQAYADELVKQKVKKLKRVELPYGPETQKDADDEPIPTGRILFRAKLNRVGTKKDKVTKFYMQPSLFDSQNRPFPKGIEIGGGSVIRLVLEVKPFFMPKDGVGISLRIKQVQVIRLVKQGEQSSAFGIVEDGYSGASESNEEYAGAIDTAKAAAKAQQEGNSGDAPDPTDSDF